MKRQASPRTGIKEIAKLANVSIGTVDRVLHNRGEVAETTRKQVLEIIDEFGYTPNVLAKSLASKTRYIISILVPEAGSNSYWEKPLTGILAAQLEIKKFNFELHIETFDYNDEASFIQKSQSIIESKPNGFIFAPIFYEASLQLIGKCDAHKIPYVFFDVFIDNCNNLAYFGQNSIQSGYLAASLMNYCISRQNTNLCIINPVNPSAPVYHQGLREKGFRAYFAQHPDIKVTITSLNVDTSSPLNLARSLKNIFENGQKPTGLFVANSRVHLVAEYLDKNQMNDVVVIGYDLLQKNIEYLEKGTVKFLISQKPEEQGYKSVLSLFNYLFLHKPVEKLNYSPIDIIMKENMEYYKNFKM